CCSGSSEHLRTLANDLRHACRALMKSPSFSATALLAIILGVCTTTSVFSLVKAVLLRSLPYGNPERLLYLWTPLPGAPGFGKEISPSYADLLAWQRLSRSFADITAVQRYAAYLDEGRLQRIGVARILGNFARTLEIRPALGRLIDASDDHPGSQLVAVISDDLWHTHFEGSFAVLGKIMDINRRPYRVVGVMPKGFSYPHGNDFPGQYQFASLARTDVWVPAAVTPKEAADPDFSFDAVIGRLRPGIHVTQAQAEMSAIEGHLALLHRAGMRDAQAASGAIY
ncbi:MAG: ABC transporter permease, partial [Bryobacteraceae bacterium]